MLSIFVGNNILNFYVCWLQMLQEFADDVVPLIIPAKGGAMQAVRVVLTSSKEDKDLLQVATISQSLVMILVKLHLMI